MDFLVIPVLVCEGNSFQHSMQQILGLHLFLHKYQKMQILGLQSQFIIVDITIANSINNWTKESKHSPPQCDPRMNDFFTIMLN